MYKSHRYNTGGFLFSLTYKHKKKSDKPVQLFRASCRIRTNDPEITDQALEDSKGAGRMGLTRIQHVIEYPCRGCFSIAGAKVDIFSEFTIPSRKKMKKIGKIRVFSAFYTLRLTEKDYFCSHY